MDTDGHGFYRADGIFEHESHEFHESHSNIFGTRMDADGHGFTVRMLFLNTNCTNFTNIFGYTDTHGWTQIFTMRMVVFLNTNITNCTNIFWHTDTHG